MMSRLEQLANEVGNDPKRLEKRLRSAVSLMVAAYRLRMKFSVFSFENRCLVSLDGSLVAQWTTREHPSQPESYANQQTSSGCVQLFEVVPKN